jgi:hypothetical protein
MPTALTFNSLTSDIQNYLERGDPTVDKTFYNQIPRLINNAEREINYRLKVQGDLVSVQATFSVGVAVYAKPDRWRRTVSMNYGALSNLNSRQGIYPRAYEYVRAYWQDDTVLAPPEFYADYDYSHWIVAPTPDQSYPWEINYYRLPALLDQTNTTNWITQYAPSTLLYRTLLECAPFIKNDERIPTWQAMYEESITALGAEDTKKIVDRNVTRQEA